MNKTTQVEWFHKQRQKKENRKSPLILINLYCDLNNLSSVIVTPLSISEQI